MEEAIELGRKTSAASPQGELEKPTDRRPPKNLSKGPTDGGRE